MVLRRINLRFAVFLALYGGVVWLAYRDEVLGDRLAPLAEFTARVTLFLIRQLGVAADRAGAVITHPDGFAYEIAYTCTGFLPVLTFIVCILAYPGNWRAKGIGMALGVPVLVVVNLLRLVNLFYIGVRFPYVFAWAHEVLWEGLLAMVFIALWLGWIGWSTRIRA